MLRFRGKIPESSRARDTQTEAQTLSPHRRVERKIKRAETFQPERFSTLLERMNELEYKRLREISWRRKLTADEEMSLQPYLIAHPEAQAEWEDEAALSQALEQLPNAPLSSNFTAQVLLLVDLEEASLERRSKLTHDWRWWINHLIPRFALGVLTVSLGALGLLQYQKHSLEERAQSLGAFNSQ